MIHGVNRSANVQIVNEDVEDVRPTEIEVQPGVDHEGLPMVGCRVTLSWENWGGSAGLYLSATRSGRVRDCILRLLDSSRNIVDSLIMGANDLDISFGKFIQPVPRDGKLMLRIEEPQTILASP